MSRARVTVAGAGALGLNAALALAEAGCEVRICDPANGSSASALAAGMLAPAFEAALDPPAAGHFGLLLAARDLWPELAGRTGVEIDRTGAAAAGSAAWIADVRARLARIGVSGAELSSAAQRDLAPGIRPGLEAVLVREDWRLDPRRAMTALRRAAQGAGVEFDDEAVTGRGAADWLVIATGASQALAEAAPELRTLSPIKGQILRFPGLRGGGVSLRGEGAYAVPGRDGLAVGATMEPGLADTAVDPAKVRALARAGEALMPGLRGAAFEAAAGVRAATPDGLPLVGRSQTPGVMLAVGARRNGWLLAPLVAQVVAACVTGRETGPYAARLDPGRFAGEGAG